MSLDWCWRAEVKRRQSRRMAGMMPFGRMDQHALNIVGQKLSLTESMKFRGAT